jgi:uncharacterized membrane protein YbaN (DUF454 family)
MWRIIRVSLGVFFLLLGLVGLFLPVLQGMLFLALGALLLSIDLPVFNRVVCWIERRYPRTGQYLERFREKLQGRGEGPPTCPPEEESRKS